MEKDIMVTCPYNKAHRIRRYKLATHIIKCKKQYGSETNKVMCPLDSNHVIDQDGVRDHLSSCSNISCLIQNNVEEKIDAPIIDSDTHKSVENWDETPEVPTYDAMSNAASKNVIRCMNGLTKSARLKYRMNERERIAKLNVTSPTLERAQPLHKETIHEIAVRPPHDIAQAKNNTKVSQGSSKNVEQVKVEQDSDANSIKLTTENEFLDTFQKTLYNELLSDCKPDDTWKGNTHVTNESQYIKLRDGVKTSNSLQKLEFSMASNDTLYKSFNYPSPFPGPSARSQSEISLEKKSKKEKNFSLADKNQEVEGKKKQKDVIEVNTSCDIFDANTSKREIEDIEDTHNANTTSERVTDKLLALLTDKIEKIAVVEKTKENDENYKTDENKDLGSKWKNIIDKLNNRLDSLTNAQSAIAEQNAQLVKEVSDLKQLKSCCNTQSVILNNPRCAANFTEQISPLNTYSKNHMFQKEPIFLENTPSSYNVNRSNDMYNLKDSSELPKLKTPEDFSRC